MALNTNVAKAAVKAAVDAIVDKLDTGTAATKAKVQIYSGSQPASADAAINTVTNVKLAEIELETTAFGAATTGTGGEASYIKAEADGLPNTDTAADATGTAAWFRAVNQAGTAIIDGTVGANTTSFDMSIDNTSIKAGQTVKLNSWKVRMPFK